MSSYEKGLLGGWKASKSSLAGDGDVGHPWFKAKNKLRASKGKLSWKVLVDVCEGNQPNRWYQLQGSKGGFIMLNQIGETVAEVSFNPWKSHFTIANVIECKFKSDKILTISSKCRWRERLLPWMWIQGWKLCWDLMCLIWWCNSLQIPHLLWV